MTNSISFGFGERLREARRAAGLTGAQLGEGAGESGKDASKASVSDWENERHYPKADQLRVICLKLNISADHLVFGDIRNELNFIQAESSIEMLSPAQRQALIAKMLKRNQVPSHEEVRPKEVQRVITQAVNSSHIDTAGDMEEQYITSIPGQLPSKQGKKSAASSTDRDDRPSKRGKRLQGGS